MRKKIIVTGGYGFIGSRFVDVVYRLTDWQIINIDKMTYAADETRVSENIRNDEDRYIFLKCDISDSDMFEKHECLRNANYIVNFAAETHVDNSIENGKPFIDSNIGGTFNLLEGGRKYCKLDRFVQVSTDEVYGDMNDLRKGSRLADESFRLRPSSYYSAAKASADLMVMSAARTFDIPYLITRCCNNFGPNQHPEKMIPKAIQCIKEDKPIPVYGDGNQVREWIHVDDHVEIIYGLMTHEQTVNEVFNISLGEDMTNNALLNMMEEVSEKKIKREEVKDRLGHDRIYRLNTRKLDQFLLFPWIGRDLTDFLADELKKDVVER